MAECDFHKRGYPRDLVELLPHIVLESNMSDLIHGSHKERSMTRIPFVSVNNDLSPKITDYL